MHHACAAPWARGPAGRRPGGPAHREGAHGEGRRIEKGDMVVAIDPDGDSGFTRATDANVIQLLRGADSVGSHVTLQILKRIQAGAGVRASTERCETVPGVWDIHASVAVRSVEAYLS